MATVPTLMPARKHEHRKSRTDRVWLSRPPAEEEDPEGEKDGKTGQEVGHPIIWVAPLYFTGFLSVTGSLGGVGFL